MRTGEVLAVVAESMDGWIVDAGLDAVFLHKILEGGAAVTLWEEDGADVGGRDAGVIAEGDGELGGEVCAVMGDDFAPALVVGRELFELLDSQSSANFVDAVVVTEVDNIVGVGVASMAIIGEGSHPMRAQKLEFGSEFIRAGGKHATFSGCEVFVGEEGEATYITPGTKGFAFQGRAGTMGSVFDDVEVVLFGDIEYGGHVTGVAAIVHDDDGFGAGGDAGCDGGGGDGEVIRAGDVSEDYLRSGVEDGVGSGDEGEGGDNDLIAGTDA